LDLFAQQAPTDADELRALVALSLVPGVGPSRVRALLAHFESASAVMAASPRSLARADGVGPQTAQAIRDFDGDAVVEEQFERAARVGAELVPLWDERYPRLLRQIYDPPAVLWLRGDLVPQDERAVAIVGTRRATDYGKRVAHHFAYELARRGFTVVSGLAYGIDAAAHRGALEAGGRTLAILGSGVDRVYPNRNKPLAEQIAAGQGGVLSEFALGTKPDAPNFPRRNRIIAGCAHGTLVAEARKTGGALITAWMATEQNRAVWAAPAALFAPTGEGTNQLIRKGYATLVTTVDELLEEIEGQLAPLPAASSAPTPASSAPAESPTELNGPERKLYEALSAEPVHLDTLCERTGLDTSNALVYLLSLEFKGLVRQLAGKQFFRA
jgi:DNA processing protein